MQVFERRIGSEDLEIVVALLEALFETGESLILLPERRVDLDQLEGPDILDLGAVVQFRE